MRYKYTEWGDYWGSGKMDFLTPDLPPEQKFSLIGGGQSVHAQVPKRVTATCKDCGEPISFLLGRVFRPRERCQACTNSQRNAREMRRRAVEHSKYCKWSGFTDNYGPMPGAKGEKNVGV